MIDFSELAENAKDFLSERKKGVLISAILVVLFCAALIVLATVSPVKIKSEYKAEPFTADQELLLPQAPSAPQSYSQSREKRDAWQSDEVQRWLLIPDDAALKKLSDANDDMIKEILEDAP